MERMGKNGAWHIYAPLNLRQWGAAETTIDRIKVNK